MEKLRNKLGLSICGLLAAASLACSHKVVSIEDLNCDGREDTLTKSGGAIYASIRNNEGGFDTASIHTSSYGFSYFALGDKTYVFDGECFNPATEFER